METRPIFHEADARDAALFAEGTRRRHSSGTRVDVFHSERETLIPGRDLYACVLVQLPRRYMQPDIKFLGDL